LLLADDAVFANYKNIACARCATEEERPADYKQGICVYSSGVKSNISITGKAVKDSVNALIANGCTRCGSVPIVPGAKDDSEGNIQINFVRGACETGICPQQVIREVDDTSAAGGSVDTSGGAESVSALTYDNFADKAPATTSRSAAPDSADTLLGINCRGSGSCTGSCERQIYDFQYYLQWLGMSSHISKYAITNNTPCRWYYTIFSERSTHCLPEMLVVLERHLLVRAEHAAGRIPSLERRQGQAERIGESRVQR
jgi:ferredoxin